MRDRRMSCFRPTSQQQLSEWIVESADSDRKIHWLTPLGQEAERSLELTEFDQVIDYPYWDMTITVETGMTVSRLQEVLKEHQQWLPVNVPRPDQTTLAEVICQNWFGSFAAGYGTIRDWLLGVSAIDGRGRIFHAGGRVVKNVAGYDLCKLLVGSRGELAIPVSATLQVKPQPQQILAHRMASKTVEGLRKLWQAVRDLPFNPVVFDVISAGEDSAGEDSAGKDSVAESSAGAGTNGLRLSCAIEGTADTVQRLSDEIRQTVEKLAETELLEVLPWDSQADPWIAIEQGCSQSVVMRIGSLPSQTVDVLAKAKKYRLSGFGLSSRGVSVLKSFPATESAKAIGQVQRFLEDLSCSATNIQCLSGHEIPGFSCCSSGKGTSSERLAGKLKAEFDPHQLFGTVTEMAK